MISKTVLKTATLLAIAVFYQNCYAKENVRVCDSVKKNIAGIPMAVIDCRVENAPAYVYRAFIDQRGNQVMKNVPGAGIVSCDQNSTCVHKGEFMGNAPGGLYAVTTGWYLGVSKSGMPTAYIEGIGPGFNGAPYDDTAVNNKDASSKRITLDISCMQDSFGTKYGCMIGDEVIEDKDLPKHLPLLDEDKVKSEGGNCESTPLCYDKDNFLIGLNKKLF